MIRPFTCFCLALAFGSGLYTYQAKHSAQLLDREVQRTLDATRRAQDRIGTLRTDWALLQEPERLAELARLHLGQLRTLQPGQFVQQADLGTRLPPPTSPGAVQMLAEDEGLPLPPAVPAASPVPQGRPVVAAVRAPTAAPAPARILEARSEPARSEPARTEPPHVEARAMPMPPTPSQPVRTDYVKLTVARPAAPPPAPAPMLIGARPMLAPLVQTVATPPRAAPRPEAPMVTRIAAGGPAAPAAAAPTLNDVIARMQRTAPAYAPGYAAYTPVMTSSLGGSYGNATGARPALAPPVPVR